MYILGTWYTTNLHLILISFFPMNSVQSSCYCLILVSTSGLWFVSATIAEFILTNLFSVVQPLVNKF